MRLLLIFLLTIILTGCKDKIASTETEIDPNSGMGLVRSINDTVMYWYDPVTNKMKAVMNLKYHKNKFYSTRISNDTLELGETFIGEVNLKGRGGQIKLQQPTDSIVDNDLQIKYIPQTKGLFEFKGQVTFDSIEFPFEYKFIVVDKGTRKYNYEFVGKMRQGFDSDRKD
jgi:hypothetical protein